MTVIIGITTAVRKSNIKVKFPMYNVFYLNYLFHPHSNPARKVLAQGLSVMVKSAFLDNPQELGLEPTSSRPFPVNRPVSGGMRALDLLLVSLS